MSICVNAVGRQSKYRTFYFYWTNK